MKKENVLVSPRASAFRKEPIAGLKREAEQANVSLVFYGHTHIAKAEQEEGILFINPGSISQTAVAR